MKDITKRYDNGEIVVVWKPSVCVHSGVCFRGLAPVFDPRRRPWIMLENSDTPTIVAQVARCPSGALSIEPSPQAAKSVNPVNPVNPANPAGPGDDA